MSTEKFEIFPETLALLKATKITAAEAKALGYPHGTRFVLIPVRDKKGRPGYYQAKLEQ